MEIQHSRSDVRKLLGKIRYGRDRPLSVTTLWRWCDMAGIEPGKEWLLHSEVAILAELADLYAAGARGQEIEKFLHERGVFA